ncbi:hypothetical protein JOL62DRAFT_339951 [Phyllosticta paracitricarpa]|uniref:Uncharacterized protein n=1 Tax=Phyllosticta paracitricarpa TaxID=2016321 RepID=A0ABR1NG57_9PEZI
MGSRFEDESCVVNSPRLLATSISRTSQCDLPIDHGFTRKLRKFARDNATRSIIQHRSRWAPPPRLRPHPRRTLLVIQLHRLSLHDAPKHDAAPAHPPPPHLDHPHPRPRRPHRRNDPRNARASPLAIQPSQRQQQQHQRAAAIVRAPARPARRAHDAFPPHEQGSRRAHGRPLPALPRRRPPPRRPARMESHLPRVPVPARVVG